MLNKAVEAFYLALHFDKMRKARQKLVIDGTLGMRAGVLLHIADRCIRRSENTAAVRLELAVDYAKERSLSHAVCANEADLVALFDIKAHVLEQRPLDEAFCQVVYA